MDNEWKDQFDYYYKKVNNANVESAQKQMDFQREMSNTSHVREVKDLIAAGLNPVLSANNGASTPAGAYANVDSSPISAKFASQNLNKELENARLITRMQNDNSYAIAMQQLAAQMQMNKYTTDENNRTSRFNTIVNEYGALAGLVYGMTEGMYDNLGVNVNGAIESMASNDITLKGLLDSIGNTSQKSQETQDRTDALLDESARLLGYKDHADYKYSKLANKAFNKIHWSIAKGNSQSLPNLIKKSLGKKEHKKAFNKFKPSKSYW